MAGAQVSRSFFKENDFLERFDGMSFSLGRPIEIRTDMVHSSSRRVGILAGFALLLILITGITFVLRRQLNDLMVYQQLVTHTRQVRFELERTESLLVDSEAGQRGFLYTGDPKFLAPYDLAIAQVEPNIDILAQLTADDPHQQARISALRSLAQARLAELGQAIYLYSSGHPEEARALVTAEAGRAATSNIRMLIEQMEQEETSLELSHVSSLQSSDRATILSIYLTGLIKVLGLIALAYYILLQLSRRDAYLDEIRKREELYRVTLASIGDAVICTDSGGRISYLNEVAERLTGWEVAEARDLAMDEVFQILDPETGKTVANPVDEAAKQGWPKHHPINEILVRRDGDPVFIETSIAQLRDRAGRAAGAVIAFRDVSAARELEAQIVHASQHDSLTGLPNRVLLNDRVGQAIALSRRRMGQAALLFMDVDGFKQINDSLGHPTGDLLLQSIAKRLQECVRSPDTVSRLGGDEFVVLLQDVLKPENAATTAERVLKAVAEPHPIDHQQLYVTASIGVSMYPEDGADAETLLKNADTAMYSAKATGRQCYRFFTPSMGVEAVEQQTIEEDLRQALNRNEFTLHYQPTIHLRTGAITGAEALLRWTHPRRGLVSPAEFIPAAERSGLIQPIGAWVLREACRQARVWADQGLPIATMTVNVSGVQFRGEKFLEGILGTLGETGLNPGSLDLDLTESVLMQQPELALSILNSLREKGVTVSVDDFGKGYSSLSSLRKLPLDSLKIDRSFVHQLRETPIDSAIASAMISMGRSLNLRVVAEGVETAGDLAFLKAHGCDDAQGFFFSRPVPAEEFSKLFGCATDAAAQVN
jgi:diguanylate cyclase (GGDEF)-like protein/PAS domain S-box-containing protein